MTQPDIYLDDRYTALINALVNVAPCPVTGERSFDQVQQVFCQFNVWPDTIKDDVAAAYAEDAEKQRAAQ